MLLFGIFIESFRDVFVQLTKPTTFSSGIFVVLRICAIVSMLSFLLSIINNYDVINCGTDGKDVSLPAGNSKAKETFNFLKAASTLCYMQASFFFVNYTTEEEFKVFGIGAAAANEVIDVEYYQWVPFALFFLSLSCILPEKLWELNDGSGQTKIVMNGLDKHMNQPETQLRITASAKYFVRSLELRPFPYYLVVYEYFGVGTLWASEYILDVYLGGRFLRNIPKGVYILLRSRYEDFGKFMYELFPKVTKCTFQYFGPSGRVQSKDFICTLSMNVLYEKLFLLLWVTLTTATAIASFLLIRNSILLLSCWLRKRYMLLLHWWSDAPKSTDCLRRILLKTKLGDDVILMHFETRMVYYSEWLKKVDDMIRC